MHLVDSPLTLLKKSHLGVIHLNRSVRGIVLAGVLLSGCNTQTSPPAAKALPKADASKQTATTATDEPDAVTTIEAITDKIRRDGSSIIEVDFRGKNVTDASLEPLTKLPRLRSVLLLGTDITDDGLKSLGKIPELQNLDLRECAVSNDGLAHLTSLKKLKALKLSGKNGKCSVDDDGMVHVAKLKNLKVLAVDSLLVSEDGLQHLVGLKEMVELYMGKTSIGDEAVLS